MSGSNEVNVHKLFELEIIIFNLTLIILNTKKKVFFFEILHLNLHIVPTHYDSGKNSYLLP